MDKESEQEKSAPAATEAESKLHEELAQKLGRGEISLNQARKIAGLKRIDNPRADMKLVKIT